MKIAIKTKGETLIFAALFFVAAAFLILPFFASAATGDVIASCDFQGGGDTPTASQAVAACGGTRNNSEAIMNAWSNIELSGGADGGRYMKVRHPISETETAGMFTLGHTDVQGVTYVWWEKFDQWPITGSNIKGIRPYATNGHYIGAVMTAHCPSCPAGPNNGYWYVSPWNSATVTTTDIVTHFDTGSQYCTFISANTYDCSNASGGRLEFTWSTDGGVTAEFGVNTWHKVRMYVKLPSTLTAADGELYVWLDDQLAVYTTNLRSETIEQYTGGELLSTVALFPAEDSTAGVDYYHSIDNFTAYEGYVPPGGPDIVAPASPSGLAVD